MAGIAMLARELGAKLSLPVRPSLIRRTRFAVPQSALESMRERESNVRNAFISNCAKPLARFDKVIIVDDVLTTGSTANALSATLRRDGFAGRIAVWCVVRANLRRRD